ncbi:MAG: hypothetical protein JSR36_10225 [Proteobacteria bacterium]|nr:hypothetical protein [Pseudomonadota bacterium]
MIISHKYRYIFIKTGKTAGTSIEIALSKYAGPADVITPCTVEDDLLRAQLGYVGPQNYHLPIRRYSLGMIANSLFARRRVAYFNHMGAESIRRLVGRQIWSAYYKFCFERNPWDKVVSAYYYDVADPAILSISDYIRGGACDYLPGAKLYTIRGEVAVDEIFQFESLDKAMLTVAHRVGLPETPSLPRAKAQFRPPDRHYREVLSEGDKQEIGRIYAKEIATFGYQW